jgi:uncharacterized protein (TIGR03435 family)
MKQSNHGPILVILSAAKKLCTLLLFFVLCHCLARPALTQTALPLSPLAFEVATVKPDASNSGNSGTRFDRAGRFIATNITVKQLLQGQAFQIASSRIVGGPSWLDSAHFDVEAKIEPATFDRMKTMDRQAGQQAIQAMFQNLLADRFHFKAHWELRDLPAYALVVAKGGPKLQPAAHPDRGGGNSYGNGSLQATVRGFKAATTSESVGPGKELRRH